MDAISLPLRGHISERSLLDAFQSIQHLIDQSVSQIEVIVDCREMDGYDLAARGAFVDWNKLNKRKVSAVAVVTTNKLWHVVVATMAMMSGQTLRAFGTTAEAQQWCASQRTGHAD